jgi:hypothetical protein
MPETKAKGRAQRIPLDYYKKPDGIQKAKLGLAVLALILSIGWWASGLEFRGNQVETGARGLLRYSKGPLASVHETWNDKCDACHRPFTPIDGKRWSPPIFTVGHESDQACLACHQGPPHAKSEIPDQVKSCAGCHVDHRGHNVSLVRLNDTECTSCHADLSLHRSTTAKSSGIADKIHSFANDHPPFSTEGPNAKDPGRLKFNHALHLNPGLTHKPGDRDIKAIAYLRDPESRERYRREGQKDDSPIQLDCASCHVTNSADFKISRIAGLPQSAALPVGGSGKEMLPITYENQCKACHSLSFDERNPDLLAPHRVQPPAIREFLWSTYAGMFIKNDEKLLAKVVRSKPIPGEPLEADEATVKEKIQQAVTGAEKVLFDGNTTCFECHQSSTVKADGRREDIVIPSVPATWLTKAQFDHKAHRAVNCQDCHTNASKSQAATDILIPGIASCRECHSPAQKAGFFATAPKETRGGVRHDCTTCHLYHHSDASGKSEPSLAAGETPEGSFSDFLRGTPRTESKPNGGSSN